MVKQLNVDMNGIHVALLTFKGNGWSFTYKNEWLKSSHRRPLSLSLPLSKVNHDPKIVRNFFANLLPDNPAVIAQIASNFKTTIDPFDILAAIGKDCVGSIQIYDANTTPPDPKQCSLRPLSEADAEQQLATLKPHPLGMSPDNSAFRISIAGAQEKTALFKKDNNWFLPINATPTTHILKTAIGSLENNTINFEESCENEWICLQISKAFGLPTVEAEIVKFGKQKAIAIKRYDRTLISEDPLLLLRLPSEDFCQALGFSSAEKYEADGGPGIEECMDLLKQSTCAQEDRRTFMAAQILLWLLDSTDGHAKNYSILIGRGNSNFRGSYKKLGHIPLH